MTYQLRGFANMEKDIARRSPLNCLALAAALPFPNFEFSISTPNWKMSDTAEGDLVEVALDSAPASDDGKEDGFEQVPFKIPKLPKLKSIEEAEDKVVNLN